MGSFFLYSLEVALCLAVLFTIYYGLLGKETFFAFNRISLLTLVLVSLVVPFIHVDLSFWGTNIAIPSLDFQYEISLLATNLSSTLSTALSTDVADSSPQTITPSLWIGLFLAIIYMAGVLFFIGRYALSMLQIGHMIRRGESVRQPDGVYLVRSASCQTPFSWMHYIVVPAQETVTTPLYLHELAHIKAGHSWDLLLINLVVAFQWFNPAVWFLRRHLENVHEFQADAQVLKSGANSKEYQLLLIQKAVNPQLFALANSLTQQKLKKRLSMMWQKKSNPWARSACFPSR